MRVKYPRTMHLPTSQGVQNDDRVISSLDQFIGKEIVITEKMDGENWTMYNDHSHARSLDSKYHESRNWVKNFHGTIAHEIPDGWRICGENMFARHSIAYDNLESYFYGFSIWNSDNIALSWDETLLWFESLGITPVRELYRGEYSDIVLSNLISTIDCNAQEGFVMRVTDEIPFSDFDKLVAKWVRKGHVQTDKHWMHQEVVPNKLMSV